MSRQLYVYFIEVEGYVKIGQSFDVRRRFRNISISTPFEPKLLGYIKATGTTEMTLHENLGHLRQRGEWFRLTDDLRKLIDDHCEKMVIRDERRFYEKDAA